MERSTKLENSRVTYIGAENIITALGSTAKENFDSIISGKTGLQPFQYGNTSTYISKRETFNSVSDGLKCIDGSLAAVDKEIFKNGKTQLIISTTKGEITALEKNDIQTASLHTTLNKFKENSIFDDVQLISNACISGVMALIVADSNIRHSGFDHVVVLGVDQISAFTLSGFESFFALSDEACKPFDKDRKGISLGEGGSSIVLSNNPELFFEDSYKFLGGCSMNDANHISGPSRTGEGLFKSVEKTIKLSGIKKSEIDFISAHGTGTNYNDEMESIAFERAGLTSAPLNSLKGYFGHTFGAAGTIETAICLQSLRNNMLAASHGYSNKGVSGKVNVIGENKKTEVKTILKTASGFGGCNASILIQK